MELLKISINADGYTQPIVSFKEENEICVVDGFHRSRIGKEDEEIYTLKHQEKFHHGVEYARHC